MAIGGIEAKVADQTWGSGWLSAGLGQKMMIMITMTMIMMTMMMIMMMMIIIISILQCNAEDGMKRVELFTRLSED